MPTVWPFRPRSELVEAVEWLTNILPAFDTEERLCLRDSPLREFTISHISTQPEQALAREIARGDGVLLLPEWSRQVVANAYPGAPVALPDGPVLIWQSITGWEQSTVSGGVLGAVATPLSSVRIMPLLTCRVTDAWRNDRPAGRLSEQGVTLQTADGDFSEDDTLYPIYTGHPFVTDCPVVGSSTANEGLSWENDTTDNGIALPDDVRASGWANETFTMRWYSRNVATLRKWIYSRRGRYLPFWLPSWADDMPDAVAAGASLQTSHYDPTERHVACIIDGSIHPRYVTDAAFDSGSGTWVLTLFSALPAGTLQRAMYLRLVRFNADRIEFRHAAAAGVSVAVQCVRVHL